jgi:hypothetical protein
MKHTTRVERFILIDILVGACGAAFGTAVLQVSWKAAILGALLAASTYLLERETIEEEERPEGDDSVRLTESAFEALKQSAAWKGAEKILPEDRVAFELGLKAGAAELAQFVLEEIEIEQEKESV